MATSSPEPTGQTQTTAVTGREGLIPAIKTPLGFFSLVLLVVEVILGVVAGLSTGVDRTVAIIGMVVIIACLVGIVAYFAHSRPEALEGRRYTRETREEPLESIKVERVFCGVTAEYAHLGFKDDVAIIRQEFCDEVVEDHELTLSSLQEHLTKTNYTVVHLLGFVDPMTGEFRLSANERVPADGLIETCQSLRGTTRFPCDLRFALFGRQARARNLRCCCIRDRRDAQISQLGTYVLPPARRWKDVIRSI